MKITTAIIPCLFLLTCKAPKAFTYEQGHQNCDKEIEAKKKENPGSFFFVGPSCILGSSIPPFQATTLSGKQIDANYFKGKVTVINFWFIACHPCVAEIPGFNKIVQIVGKNKVNYLAIGRDSEIDIRNFLTKHPWEFDHIGNANNLIYDVFRIRWGFPTTFLVNKKSEIVLAFSGGKTDESAVQEIQDKLLPKIEVELRK